MKTLDEYLDLPYAFAITHDVDEDGNVGWVAEIEELPGCISQGASPEEALEHVRDAMRDWISIALEDNVEVPQPRADADYSGRFVVRVPASLHADLVRRAGHEGVSLNQFVTSALAGAVGWRGGRSRGSQATRRQPAKRSTTAQG
ncbi:MAG: type II toxin-antitoxin system HicB family antitoxin [bacterium]|jgi:predicted RNase H-like HicB family nuclease|nr:type II toxin-antitoxin system HicB family antitoxin [bacterium]